MFDPKTNVAVVSWVTSSGPELMNVSGSGPIVHRWMAGVGSTLPDVSTARTRRTCEPGSRSRNWPSPGQELKAGPSRAHSNVAKPSFELNTNTAFGFTVWVGGAES